MIEDFSIVIRVGKNEPYVGFTIQSVLDIFKDPEIIIVNNDMDEDTYDIVTDFPFTNIHIIKLNDYTPGKALNLGVKNTKKEYVLFLSSHCKITKFDLDIKLFDTFPVIFGKQIPVYRGKKITPRYLWKNFIDTEETNMWSVGEGRYFLHFAFCAFKITQLIDFPIREDLKGKEDRYYAQELIDRNINYLYTNELECEHYFTGNGSTWIKND